jgi:pimeloyl-ACP methyl ester carboxylesterase
LDWRLVLAQDVRTLRAFGHELIVPTLTGLGERQHLAHKGIGLDTHITDILQAMHFERLANVTLIGHSYGGMVAAGVADKAARRLNGVIYLDAFVPRSGECLLDLLPNEARSSMLEAARTEGEGWKVPPNPMPPDTTAEDVNWAVARRVAQPIKTFSQPLELSGVSTNLAKTYIYCKRYAPGNVFERFSEQAQREPDWNHVELDASHNPQVTMPSELATLLDHAGPRTGAPWCLTLYRDFRSSQHTGSSRRSDG